MSPHCIPPRRVCTCMFCVYAGMHTPCTCGGQRGTFRTYALFPPWVSAVEPTCHKCFYPRGHLIGPPTLSFPCRSTVGQVSFLLRVLWDAYLVIDGSPPPRNGMPPFTPPEEGKIYSLVVNETQLDQPRSYTVQLALRKVSRCLPHLRVTCMASNQSSTLYITGKKPLQGLGRWLHGE